MHLKLVLSQMVYVQRKALNDGRPKRANVAVLRKVRCNVVEHGAPCTNCRLDEVECIVSESKRKKCVLPVNDWE